MQLAGVTCPPLAAVVAKLDRLASAFLKAFICSCCQFLSVPKHQPCCQRNLCTQDWTKQDKTGRDGTGQGETGCPASLGAGPACDKHPAVHSSCRLALRQHLDLELPAVLHVLLCVTQGGCQPQARPLESRAGSPACSSSAPHLCSTCSRAGSAHSQVGPARLGLQASSRRPSARVLPRLALRNRLHEGPAGSQAQEPARLNCRWRGHCVVQGGADAPDALQVLGHVKVLQDGGRVRGRGLGSGWASRGQSVRGAP